MPKVVTENNLGGFDRHWPRSVAIVTSSARGKDNAMTVGWHTPISRTPPLYAVAIGHKKFTYQLITESKEFGINFIPWQKASLAARLGGTSGREIDKFERFNIEREKPLRTKVPILKDAYIAYECKLFDSKTYGDPIWFVGEIVAVHFREEAFTSEGILDFGRIKPLLYLGLERYITTDEDSLRFIKRGI